MVHDRDCGVSIISRSKVAEEERARLLRGAPARGEAERQNRVKDEFLATLPTSAQPSECNPRLRRGLLRSEEASVGVCETASEILKRNALAQSQLVRDLLDLSRLHMGKLS